MKTAYYYLAEPNGEDSGTDSNKQHTDSNPLVALHRTALAHIMTFSIHALKSANEKNQWRERILPKLKTWVRTDHAVLDQTTPTPTTAGDYQPDRVASSASPSGLRARSRKRPRHGSGPDSRAPPQSSHDPPPLADDSPPPRHFTPYAAAKSQQNQRSCSPGVVASSSHKHQNHSYRTQLCLQGLARGGPLDQNCPNVSKHCEEGYQGDRHCISSEEFRVLLEAQLRRSRGADFLSLGMQGARGALFKVTLKSYGYTVVAKRAVWPCVRYLRHEAEVYRRLAAIQGEYVLVFLGSLDLDYEYYFHDGIRIVQ